MIGRVIKKNIFAIIGSASDNSSNKKLVEAIAYATKDIFNITLFNNLKKLPHFNPQLTIENTPKEIVEFRSNIENADGIIICTPEYIFSIPSGLKNALEWSVSTTIFSEKPLGIITASAQGEKGHDELKLIMKTVMAKFNEQTTLLIQGIKGKIDEQGHLQDELTKNNLNAFIGAFKQMLQVE